ncbi:MAG: N-acetyltransferase [Cyanobium sp.]
MIPFRPAIAPPRLPEGYTLLQEPDGMGSPGRGGLSERISEELNRLLLACGDQPRSHERWQATLERSSWSLRVCDPEAKTVGFLRTTSDQALNANLWDLLTDPSDPARDAVLTVLVRTALGRLRRELGGCSISVSAPPEAIAALSSAGFLLDPGGIRAMGLALRRH